MERTGKRGARMVAVAAGLIAVAAGFAAGFALGSGDAVGADEADAAQTEAKQLAAATTRAVAWSESLGDGVEQGEAEGEESGRRAGNQAGRSEALDTLDASEVGARSHLEIGGGAGWDP